MTSGSGGDLGRTRGLLHEALAGDEGARGDLLERLRPRLVLWVSTRLSKELRRYWEPEDVAQEILLAVHKSLDGFRERGDRAFYGWLFRVAENRVRDLADYAGAKKRRAAPIRSFSQTSPSSAAIRSEQFQRLHDALLSLSEDYRRVIVLLKLEEKGVSEVASLMERSEVAVRILFCRALRALRKAMPEETRDSG